MDHLANDRLMQELRGSLLSLLSPCLGMKYRLSVKEALPN